MNFVCSVCGKEHPAIDMGSAPDNVPAPDPEKAAELKTKWYASVDRLVAAEKPTDKHVNDEMKACSAYFAHVRPSGWKIPNGITFSHGVFHCVGCEVKL